MSQTSITKLDNGPLMIKGDFQLVDGKGETFQTAEQVFICRCGQSTNQPFCSGAHKGKYQEASAAR